MVDLKFLGGADEVGRLGIMMKISNKNLLLDYGMNPTKPPQFPMESPQVSHVLLSHAHLDHSGMVPWVVREYGPKIISTSVTRTLSDVLAKDSIKISMDEGHYLPFTEKDVRNMWRDYDLVSFGSTRTFDEFDIIVHSAGHIPGACMYEIRGEKNILFTGDLNTLSTRLISGTKSVKCDILIMESTYAGREHPDRKDLEKRFLEKIEETVASGGRVILPVFAVGRTQEMLLLLYKSGYEIWLDGLGRVVNKLLLDDPRYIKNAGKLRKAITYAKIVANRWERERAIGGDVIITTGGMLDGGPVLHYIMNLRNDRKTSILLTGYQVEGTNGHILLNERKIEIRGVRMDVKCNVEYFDFSAHAGHSQLVKFAEECSPEEIVLVHGDRREEIFRDLKDFTVHLPSNGEEMSI